MHLKAGKFVEIVYTLRPWAHLALIPCIIIQHNWINIYERKINQTRNSLASWQ